MMLYNYMEIKTKKKLSEVISGEKKKKSGSE